MEIKWNQERIVAESLKGLAATGVLLCASPWLIDSLYGNYIVGFGILFLFAAWILANFNRKQDYIALRRWQTQQKAMIAMSLCMLVGAALLIFYESKRPKYDVAAVRGLNYKVPPQLSKRQLKELGAECNTYGNTVCSQAVFAKIVKIDPADFIALANLSMAQTHLGFHKQAIQNFETAIEHGIKDYDVYKSYGDALLASGMKLEAMLAYEISLFKNPRQEALRQKLEDLRN